MNRLEKLFQQKSRNLLAVYFTAGYPEVNITSQTILDLDAAGADIVEIGMPFSDPLADGPTIQASSKTALDLGMSLEKLFLQLERIRESTQIPIVLMGYLNPVLQFGVERFCQRCRAAGVDGAILPDLPLAFYEKHYGRHFENHGLCPVFLVTPQTSDERIRQLDTASRGFLYAVSTSATTGKQGGFGPEQVAYFKRLAGLKLKNPVMVGFGIYNHETFETVCKYVNGGVVGSAFIRAQEKGVPVNEFVDNLKKGTLIST